MTIFFDFLRPPRLHPKQIPQIFSPAAGSNNWEGATPQSPQLPEKQKSPRTGVPKHGVTGRGGTCEIFGEEFSHFFISTSTTKPPPPQFATCGGKKKLGTTPNPPKTNSPKWGGEPFSLGKGGQNLWEKNLVSKSLEGPLNSAFFSEFFACGGPKIYRNHCGGLEGGALPPAPEKNTTTFSVGGIKLHTVKFRLLQIKCVCRPPPRSPQINNARDVSNCACLIFNCITFKVNFVLFYK